MLPQSFLSFVILNNTRPATNVKSCYTSFDQFAPLQNGQVGYLSEIASPIKALQSRHFTKNLLKPLDLRFFVFSCEKSKSIFLPFFVTFLVYNLYDRVSHAVKSDSHHPPSVTLRCSHSMSETPELERVWLIFSRRSNTLFNYSASITNRPALTMLVRIEYRSHATTASFLSPVIHSFTIH